jgi:hypothetical protein
MDITTSRVSDIVNSSAHGGDRRSDAESSRFYGETISQVWAEVYHLARMPADFDYETCQDLPMLEAILAAADAVRQQEVSQ